MGTALHTLDSTDADKCPTAYRAGADELPKYGSSARDGDPKLHVDTIDMHARSNHWDDRQCVDHLQLYLKVQALI